MTTFKGLTIKEKQQYHCIVKNMSKRKGSQLTAIELTKALATIYGNRAKRFKESRLQRRTRKRLKK